MKTAVITGITGQDGACLAEHSLIKGYNVFGTNWMMAVQYCFVTTR
ncbi:hypothetical protein [Nitrincola sp.]